MIEMTPKKGSLIPPAFNGIKKQPTQPAPARPDAPEYDPQNIMAKKGRRPVINITNEADNTINLT